MPRMEKSSVKHISVAKEKAAHFRNLKLSPSIQTMATIWQRGLSYPPFRGSQILQSHLTGGKPSNQSRLQSNSLCTYLEIHLYSHISSILWLLIIWYTVPLWVSFSLLIYKSSIDHISMVIFLQHVTPAPPKTTYITASLTPGIYSLNRLSGWRWLTSHRY